jgi:hypothetical protein
MSGVKTFNISTAEMESIKRIGAELAQMKEYAAQLNQKFQNILDEALGRCGIKKEEVGVTIEKPEFNFETGKITINPKKTEIKKKK